MGCVWGDSGGCVCPLSSSPRSFSPSHHFPLAAQVATRYLVLAGLNQRDAIDRYYADGNKPAVGDKAALKALFDKYRSQDEDGKATDLMFEDDLARFFADVKVDMKSAGPLIVAHMLKCRTPGEVTETEFVEGFSAAGASTLAEVAARVAKIVTHTNSSQDAFKAFYRWLFVFAKAGSEVKALKMEDAQDMWRSVLPFLPTPFPRWREWVLFVRANVKYVYADLWNSLLEFTRCVKADLSDHSVADAWNTEIDQFVASEKAREAKAAADAQAAAGPPS